MTPLVITFKSQRLRVNSLQLATDLQKNYCMLPTQRIWGTCSLPTGKRHNLLHWFIYGSINWNEWIQSLSLSDNKMMAICLVAFWSNHSTRLLNTNRSELHIKAESLWFWIRKHLHLTSQESYNCHLSQTYEPDSKAIEIHLVVMNWK